MREMFVSLYVGPWSTDGGVGGANHGQYPRKNGG